MTTTKKIWIALAVVLVAGIYVYVYADWFKPVQVQIFHRLTAGRPLRGRWREKLSAPVLSVAFGFDRKLKLTDVKVVSVAALATNQNALAVWHLVSESNSVPVKAFLYGDFIRGMKPAVKGTAAQPLETNMTYRLFIKAGSMKAQHDFTFGKSMASPVK
jgi:hypothetical protein